MHLLLLTSVYVNSNVEKFNTDKKIVLIVYDSQNAH
jgi:hypothetical protein